MAKSATQRTIAGVTLDRVFILSLLFVAAFGAWGLIDPEGMSGASLGFTTFMLTGVGWYWLLICTGFLILAGYMAFGPYGHIKLGADDEEPEFSTTSWIAMLFAGGMGAGLIFWGVAEPLYHFRAPPGMAGETAEAARRAFALTNLHWGLHAWATYGICALVIAYFTFRKGARPMISTPIEWLFPGNTGRRIGGVANVLGVVAVVFGLAGSLTMGTLQIRAGLGELVGTPINLGMSLLIMGIMYATYMTSAAVGVDRGIKLLSNINMIVAILLLLFITLFGPTAFIFETFIDAIGTYLTQLPALAFRLLPFEGEQDWTASWTLTYLIWWLAWGPFVGIFIARISRGRTIREFCAGVILAPTLFSIFWFAALGGAGIYIELVGAGGIAELVFQDVTRALFVFLDYFPLGQVLGFVALFLIFIFLVTSADSGGFVLSMMTSSGSLNPALAYKLIWGTLVAVLTVATLFSGSVDVAKAMAVTGAVPFSVVLLLQVVGFLREIRGERCTATAHRAEPESSDGGHAA
ncbi:BCCT family transporter [Thiohalocapsa marina]|uniref:BCCT family transporter n=1 Tax=Thiohalocapsa marina TaxID=424902 RepID=A0A5M8FPE2_9GAMM|nr:BCCT family transporter [Thiohalocapsa marina]KAA6186677.1 BCCT family transporter [Thiohalocapsa marina]